MRTLILAPEVFEREGGIQRILRLYVKAFCEIAGPNDDVGLIALNDSVIADSELAGYTNRHLYFWMGCTRDKKRFSKEAIRGGRTANRLVCGHIGQAPIALLIKLLRPKIKYYVVAHGIEAWGPLSPLKRLALKAATKVICVSEYTKIQLEKQVKFKPGRVTVLYNALDPRFTIEPGEALTLQPPVILTVTRLSHADRYKGVEHLIEAMPTILKSLPTATLRIVGRGDDQVRLQKLATKLGVNGSSVIFLGYVSDAEMKNEMGRCNLFALPSRDEGFGLVYLEAMARGRPCLGTRSGAAPEVIREGTGVLTDYGNIPEIAAQCVAALAKRWNAEFIADNARWFSYTRFKESLQALLAQEGR